MLQFVEVTSLFKAVVILLKNLKILNRTLFPEMHFSETSGSD